MSDFIREVDEDYRRDRVMKVLTRYQLPLVVAIIAIVLGSGLWRWYQDSQVTAAQQQNIRFSQAVDLAKAGKDADAEAAFSAMAKDGSAGYATLARMRAAEVLIASDPDASAQAFDAIAGDDALPASLRDTARFRGALLRVDREDPKAFESRYGRFTIPGFAFHNSIREMMALTALKLGDAEAAGRYLDDIVADPGAPAAMRNRAEAFRLLVNAGPAMPSPRQASPAEVTPVQAAPPPPAIPPATAIPSPPSPSPAAPPAAAAKPIPPAGTNPPPTAAPE